MDFQQIKSALIEEEARLNRLIAESSATLRGVQSAIQALNKAHPQSRKHTILPRCREWISKTTADFTVHDLRAGVGLKITQMAWVIGRLVKLGEVAVVRPRSGNTPGKYRKS